jgi:hypothetical protein
MYRHGQPEPIKSVPEPVPAHVPGRAFSQLKTIIVAQ